MDSFCKVHVIAGHGSGTQPYKESRHPKAQKIDRRHSAVKMEEVATFTRGFPRDEP